MNDLGKRALACKSFKWLPGMPATCVITLKNGNDRHGIMVVHSTENGEPWCLTGANTRWNWAAMRDAVPIVDGPAATGCLMQMLRDAYPTAEIRIDWLPADDTTTIRIDDGTPWLAGNGATLASALVAALEAQRCPV
jgi:hypothetical protein